MFTNFIYFIVVLLIYATYQPSDSTNFSPGETALLFFGLVIAFGAVARMAFGRIVKQLAIVPVRILDRQFTATQLRLSILSVGLYGADIYLLNLPDFMAKIPVLGSVPTVQAVFCIALFIGYLAIVWAASHDAYRRLYPSALGKGGYVLSNISFAVPVLLPWFILSAVSDILYALPFESVRKLLASTWGELLYILLFLAAIAILGPAMIQKFWRCKPLPAGFDRTLIENICRKARVSYRDIVQWPVFGGHMITAGVMGLIRQFRYILVTRGLLSSLTPDELTSVIAHEIGHVKKKHLLFYLFFFTGYILISYAAFDIIVYLTLYSRPAFFLVSTLGYDQASLAPVLLSGVMIVFFLVYFRFIFGFFMRNFERQADAYAFSMLGTARPLVSTFQKIAFTSGQSPDKPNWHHFSIRQRIDFLERCELDEGLPARHDRKVFRSVAVFLISLLTIGWFGYQLNYGEAGKRLNAHLLEEIIQREIEKSPDDVQLLAMVGDLYYSRNDFGNTVDAYEQALSKNFALPHVLNNLAWLYATCSDERFRNPERALVLALKAVELAPSAESWDTLAESYYLNGQYEKAVEAGASALDLAGRNREYYREQLEKFRSGVNRPG